MALAYNFLKEILMSRNFPLNYMYNLFFFCGYTLATAANVHTAKEILKLMVFWVLFLHCYLALEANLAGV